MFHSFPRANFISNMASGFPPLLQRLDQSRRGHRRLSNHHIARNAKIRDSHTSPPSVTDTYDGQLESSQCKSAIGTNPSTAW